ncbi:MAG: (Fe-S)-binding protein [Planctomycetaceae bacterium]
MRVALFVPCYIDQFYPDVAMATLELLESLGCEVEFPEAQTCCGQPMANTGCLDDAKPLAKRFVEIFGGYDHIVCPSGSCTSMVTHHYQELVGSDAAYQQLQPKVHELTEFLVDVLKIESLPAQFKARVGLHNSCHGLRELRLGSSSERMLPKFSKAESLLSMVEGVELIELERKDECCGFGGTFAVSEEAVSCMMGDDRIHDHLKGGAEVITAGDMSCLMHLEGLISRQKLPLKVMHIAQILVGRPV